MAGNGGAIAIGLADGVLKGLQIRRQWERDDEDRAARAEDRAYRRKDRERADALTIALQKAGQPATVSTPQDVANDDDGNAMPAAPRFEVGGQRFGTQQEADAAAGKLNDPAAVSQRVSQALLANGKPTEALQFQQQAEKYAADHYRRRLGEAIQSGFGGLESFINDSEAGQFKGKRVKAVPSEDGKSITFHTVDANGKTAPTPFTFPNDQKGVVQAAYMLDQAVTPESRYKLMVEEDRKAEDAKRKDRELTDVKIPLAEARAAAAEAGSQAALARAEAAQTRAERAGSGRTSADERGAREERLKWTSLHSEAGRRLSEAQKSLRTLQTDALFMSRARKPGSPEAAQLENLQDDVEQHKADREMYARLLGGEQAEKARTARDAAPAPGAAPAAGKPGARPAKAGKVAAPTSKAEYEAIPKGAKYQHPDDPPGTYRTKK